MPQIRHVCCTCQASSITQAWCVIATLFLVCVVCIEAWQPIAAHVCSSTRFLTPFRMSKNERYYALRAPCTTSKAPCYPSNESSSSPKKMSHALPCDGMDKNSKALQDNTAKAAVQQDRRHFVSAVIVSLIALAAPHTYSAAAGAAAVSWPAADGGLGHTAVDEPPRTADTYPALGISYADLSDGEAGVREGVRRLVRRDPALAASLLRLAFHDAISRDTETRTGGANGSIRHELDRRANYGLARPLQALAPIHAAARLSWGDTIALAGAQAVTCAGGPQIQVRLGRVDVESQDPYHLATPVGTCQGPSVQGGGTSCRGQVQTTIPDAGLDSVGIRLFFSRLGFSEEEFVALMGAHTLGRFTSLLGVPKECLKNLNRKWERCLPFGQRLPFVSQDPDVFSNSYYKWLLRWNVRDIQGGDVHFLPTDVVLVVDDGLRKHVTRFAEDERAFFRSFERAYVRLVSIGTTF